MPVEKADRLGLRIGDLVEFVRPDRSRLRTVVRGIEMADPYDPARSFAFMIGNEFSKTDVPLGAEVWKIEAGSQGG